MNEPERPITMLGPLAGLRIDNSTDALVFSDRNGEPLSADNLRKKRLTSACRRAGVGRIDWHLDPHTSLPHWNAQARFVEPLSRVPRSCSNVPYLRSVPLDFGRNIRGTNIFVAFLFSAPYSSRLLLTY